MTSKKVEITPKLENCKITDPAQDTGGKWYLSAQNKSITFTADKNCTFETAGSFVYQGSYSELTETIPASHTGKVVFTLPEFDMVDQYQPLALTMSATKKSTPKPPAPTTPAKPTQPTSQPETNTTVTTQLDVLKNSLRIPLDLKDDDKLLQGYLDGATEYLRSTLDGDVEAKLNSKRARVVINALAELMYQSRGDSTVTKDFPFALRVLINQLKY